MTQNWYNVCQTDYKGSTPFCQQLKHKGWHAVAVSATGTSFGVNNIKWEQGHDYKHYFIRI